MLSQALLPGGEGKPPDSLDGLQVHITKPTWSNHHNIFKDAGVDKKEYRYYKPSTKGLDFEGLIDDLKVGIKISVPLGSCQVAA